jgi:DNA-binding MarR family transcriptional regulator
MAMTDGFPNSSTPDASSELQLTDQQYRAVEVFRWKIRHVLAESEQACAEYGLTTQRFQALLTIRTFDGETGPSVGDVADRLLLRHHSAVELVGRLESAGLITRVADTHDRRRVLLALTPVGAEQLEALTRIHLKGLAGAKAALASLDAAP